MDIRKSDEPEQTSEDRKKQLYLRQRDLLDTFLAHHAITQQQHDKSLHDLTVKMGMEALAENESTKAGKT